MAFNRTLLHPHAFAGFECLYPKNTGSRKEHSLLFTARIFCISFVRGSTCRDHNQVLCKAHQVLLKSLGSDNIFSF